MDKTGYGVVDVQQRQWRANRYMYHMWYKVDIEDQLVCHTCDNRLCVRPNHLYLGTHADNMNDMKVRFRCKNQTMKLTETQVRDIREKYANKKKTQVQLGEEYGVGQSTISAIVLGKYWRQYL